VNILNYLNFVQLQQFNITKGINENWCQFENIKGITKLDF
jgi:hypothetical protein